MPGSADSEMPGGQEKAMRAGDFQFLSEIKAKTIDLNIQFKV